MKQLITENNVFKIKLLRNILIASLSIVTLLSLYNIFFIYPSFHDLLIESAKNDAKRVTRHIVSKLFPKQSELSKDSFNVGVLKEIEELKNDFEMMKIKAYSKTGKTVFYTDPKDENTLNKERYFHEIVAKGKVHTEVVPKSTESLEGRKVAADVVETGCKSTLL